jgi:dihydropteroate synthase
MELTRDRYPWKLRTHELTLGARTLVMGVLDVSGAQGAGSSQAVNALLEEALAIQAAGADLIDVSAQPNRGIPRRMTADEELRQMVPVLRKLRHNLDIPVSVHTSNSATAERVLELGAEIIYDWSGLTFDADMVSLAKQMDTGLILGHVRDTPDTWAKQRPLPDVVSVIMRDLQSAMGRATGMGIDRRRIVIDPGLEQGKRGLQNFRILAELDLVSSLNRPILVDLVGKPFLTESVRSPDDERLFATATAAAVAVYTGAHIIRVGEVKEISYVAKTADRMFESFEPS